MDWLKAMSVGWRVGILVAIISLIISSFFIGYTKGVSTADVKIEKYSREKNEIQNKYNSLIENPNIQTIIEYKDKWHTINQKQIKYVEVAKDVPSGGVLSNGWIETHNSAASGLELNYEKATDPTPSGVKDNEALPVITGNYAKYKQCVSQLDALQNVIDVHNDAIKKLNEGKK